MSGAVIVLYHTIIINHFAFTLYYRLVSPRGDTMDGDGDLIWRNRGLFYVNKMENRAGWLIRSTCEWHCNKILNIGSVLLSGILIDPRWVCPRWVCLSVSFEGINVCVPTYNHAFSRRCRQRQQNAITYIHKFIFIKKKYEDMKVDKLERQFIKILILVKMHLSCAVSISHNHYCLPFLQVHMMHWLLTLRMDFMGGDRNYLDETNIRGET